MNVIVTGGCGFIGCHVIRELLNNDNFGMIFNIDLLTYSGNLQNLESIKENERYRLIKGSINDKELMMSVITENNINVIINLAAESHVDRSINSAKKFIETNIDGTRNILECMRDLQDSVDLFLLHVSTDEVYGSLSKDDLPFTEDTPIQPMNPYAVTKAASDMLVQAFVNTHKIKACISRCSNNYGPNQFPEKLIPLMIINCKGNKELPIYGDGLQIRDWIHVTDHAKGIIMMIEGFFEDKVKSGEVINFGADNEITNIEIVKQIIKLTEGDENQIKYVRDRPGHDKRYAMRYDKANKKLGWSPKISWTVGIKETVEWYLSNDQWVESIKSGEYLEWIKTHYN